MPIYPYTLADGSKRYRVVYRTPDHKQLSKYGFKRKADAAEFEAEQTVAKASGTFIDPKNATTKIGELSDKWLQAKKSVLKLSSYTVLEGAWKNHVSARWSDVKLGDVRFSDVRDWVTSLAAERSATVTIRAYGVLMGILDDAVRDRRLAANPAQGVEMPKKKPKPRRYLSHEQVGILASQARKDAYRTIIYLLAYTGLRWGEMAALRVRDVDLRKHRLSVHHNSVRVGREVDETAPKTYKTRSVPFPAALDARLSACMKGRGPDARLIGDGHNPVSLPNSKNGWFIAALGRAQAVDKALPAHLSIHDLRHTAASLAISAGANVKAVQRMLGHRSAAVTLDVYADLFDDDLDAVSDAMNAAIISANVALSVAEPPSGENDKGPTPQ